MRIKIMKIKALLIQLLLFSFISQSYTKQNTNYIYFRNYIENKFNIKLTSKYVITTHTSELLKNDLITKNYLSEKKAKRILNTCLWKTNVDIFIDSVYSKDSSGKFDGIFLDFSGDSLGGYRLEYYNHGRKDSIEIYNSCWGVSQIKRYKNGSLHGASETFNINGTKSTYYNYDMGTPIDTQYMWHDNENPMRIAIYKEGKMISEKCYEEDGKTEMECDF